MEKKEFCPGDVVRLKAVRQSDIGLFLDAGTGDTNDDILLHKAQQLSEVKVGDEIEVYLYKDPHGRLTASMRLPKMKEGQVAYAQVINVTKDGAFVDIGAERGVFMPFAGMRGKVQKGERVWIKLYRDKSDRPAVTMEVEEALLRAAKPAENVKVGDCISGAVYNYNDNGAFLFTKERFVAFLHYDEMAGSKPRVGEIVTGRITFIREDGRINISQHPVKEEALSLDAAAIMAVLQQRGGKMPYSDSSAPEVIKQKFHISKAAFKRAIGRLMRQRLVEQRDGWTYIVGDDTAGNDEENP